MSPKVGQKIEYEKYEFVIEEVDNVRINRVLMRKIEGHDIFALG